MSAHAEYRVSQDRFEAYDGGHCYIRVVRKFGEIQRLRFLEHPSAEDLVRLGQWAGFNDQALEARSRNLIPYLLTREEHMLVHEGLHELLWKVGTGTDADDKKSRLVNLLIEKVRLAALQTWTTEIPPPKLTMEGLVAAARQGAQE